MSEAMKFFIMQASLFSVVLILHTYLGLHIIRRNLIFSDLVLDQLAAFGVLVAISLSIDYGDPLSYLFSLVAVLIGSFLLAAIRPENPGIPREAVIGTLYALALVACLLIGDKMAGGSEQVFKTLSGSLLWVTWPLVFVTLVVYIVLILFQYKFRKNFLQLVHNRSKKKGDLLWEFLFFATQGIITILIVPIAGVLLAYALLMIPAGTAALFLNDWKYSLFVGWGIGFIACMSGLFASYHFNWPYGPTLILFLGLFFICALFVRSFAPAKA